MEIAVETAYARGDVQALILLNRHADLISGEGNIDREVNDIFRANAELYRIAIQYVPEEDRHIREKLLSEAQRLETWVK